MPETKNTVQKIGQTQCKLGRGFKLGVDGGTISVSAQKHKAKHLSALPEPPLPCYDTNMKAKTHHLGLIKIRHGEV